MKATVWSRSEGGLCASVGVDRHPSRSQLSELEAWRKAVGGALRGGLRLGETVLKQHLLWCSTDSCASKKVIDGLRKWFNLEMNVAEK